MIIIAIILLIYLLIVGIDIAIRTIGLWFVFEKAGEKGYKVLIPIYNIYILFKISKMSPNYLLIYLAYAILSITSFNGLMKEYWILQLFFVINIIAMCALYIYQAIELGKAFKKSILWILGLIFIPSITYLFIAFDKKTVYIIDEKNL